MDHMWTRFFDQLEARDHGMMHFRVILQPVMASVFAIIAGLRDARTGKRPYFWSLVTDPAHRVEMLEDGWKSVGRVFILALVLDAIYQAYVLHFFYVGEAIIVAIVLAIVPYLILRGIVTRIAQKRLGPPHVPTGVPPDRSGRGVRRRCVRRQRARWADVQYLCNEER